MIFLYFPLFLFSSITVSINHIPYILLQKIYDNLLKTCSNSLKTPPKSCIYNAMINKYLKNQNTFMICHRSKMNFYDFDSDEDALISDNLDCFECQKKVTLIGLLCPISYLKISSDYFIDFNVRLNYETKLFYIPIFRNTVLRKNFQHTCFINSILVVDPETFVLYSLSFIDNSIYYKKYMNDICELRKVCLHESTVEQLITDIVKEKLDKIISLEVLQIGSLIELKHEKEHSLVIATNYLDKYDRSGLTLILSLERKRLQIFSSYITFDIFNREILQIITAIYDDQTIHNDRTAEFLNKLKESCENALTDFSSVNSKLKGMKMERNHLFIFQKATENQFPFLELIMWSLPFSRSNCVNAYNALMGVNVDKNSVFMSGEEGKYKYHTLMRSTLKDTHGYSNLFTFLQTFCESQIMPIKVEYEELNVTQQLHKDETKKDVSSVFFKYRLLVIFIGVGLIGVIMMYVSLKKIY